MKYIIIAIIIFLFVKSYVKFKRKMKYFGVVAAYLHVFPQKSKVPSPKIEVLQFIKRNVLVPCGRETQNADF